MGNKLARHRVVIDERYTRPQGLYERKEGDGRKLRRLILNGQLAPCFPGVEECTLEELDECPICFMFYPSLNRSRCCGKAVCTECYLQIKSSHASRPTRCPFCKTSSYMVEYRGAKTTEEKGFEQAEEQKVIEAKIRMRQKELQKELHEEEERMLRQQDQLQTGLPEEEPFEFVTANQMSMDHDSEVDSVILGNSARQQGTLHSTRSNDFDMDLEDIMLMEAIWLSIQEEGQMPAFSQQRHLMPPGDVLDENQTPSRNHDSTGARGKSLEMSCLAGAIAALAERQIITPEDRERPLICTGSDEPIDWLDASKESERGFSSLVQTFNRGSISERVLDHGSEGVEVGTSFSSSVPSALVLAPQDIEGSGGSTVSAHILPQSFEEQMMIAMALSLAEVQAQGLKPMI